MNKLVLQFRRILKCEQWVLLLKLLYRALIYSSDGGVMTYINALHQKAYKMSK